MIKIRQTFTHAALADVKQATLDELKRMDRACPIRPGQRVAVCAGSRGVANIALVTKTTVDYLRELGAQPFIVPAMGSHGNACAAGQKEVLASYGISEQTMGVPIKAGVEAVFLGYTNEHQVPVYTYLPAYEADLIIPINRIKAHTDFKGRIESGLLKMLAIGLGSLTGATTLHGYGAAASFSWLIPEVGGWLLSRLPVRFGLGLIEDSYDQTAMVRAIEAETMAEEEERLLAYSKTMLPRIMIPEFDILVVEEFGKDISGAGMDPNITGRPSAIGSTGFGGPSYQYCVVLDLTAASHGNATAISSADFITRQLFDKIDLRATYHNCLACHNPRAAMLPVIADDEQAAIRLASEICHISAADGKPRIVRIKNTLALAEILISENLLEQARGIPGITVVE